LHTCNSITIKEETPRGRTSQNDFIAILKKFACDPVAKVDGLSSLPAQLQQTAKRVLTLQDTYDDDKDDNDDDGGGHDECDDDDDDGGADDDDNDYEDDDYDHDGDDDNNAYDDDDYDDDDDDDNDGDR
jgi:hypothetical protein